MTTPPPPARPRRRWRRWALLGLAAAAVVPVFFEAYRVNGGLNDHAVIPGRVYRAGQPAERELGELTARHGIRTVVNLRGTTLGDETYQGECRATFAADVAQEDVTLSAQTLPFPGELRRMIEVLDRSEYPIVIHCKQGADRTGLVSAAVLLLYTDATPDEARRQLWPRYGHWQVARTVNMDRFFDLYENKLRADGAAHTPERFRRWVMTEYTAGPAKSQLTWVKGKGPPTAVAKGTPFTATLRCENRSDTPWQLKPGQFAGIHVSYAVYGDGPPPVWEGRAGLRYETVRPGASAAVPIPVGGLTPGRYRLVAELHDATGASVPFRTQSFTKFGDDSLVAEFEVK
jgi:protein tyrosine phosphatase (PTP) superfamily phosphohydrolase (DUF442 family)